MRPNRAMIEGRERRRSAYAHHYPGLYVHMEGRVDLQGVLTLPACASQTSPELTRFLTRTVIIAKSRACRSSRSSSSRRTLSRWPLYAVNLHRKCSTSIAPNCIISALVRYWVLLRVQRYCPSLLGQDYVLLRIVLDRPYSCLSRCH